MLLDLYLALDFPGHRTAAVGHHIAAGRTVADRIVAADHIVVARFDRGFVRRVVVGMVMLIGCGLVVGLGRIVVLVGCMVSFLLVGMAVAVRIVVVGCSLRTAAAGRSFGRRLHSNRYSTFDLRLRWCIQRTEKVDL